MQTLTVSTQNGKYDVGIGSGLLAECGERIAAVHAPCCAVIVSDSNVDALYGDACARSLAAAGFSCLRFVFPGGEQSKNFDTYLQLQYFMAENRVTRADLIVALGGGVVGDLAGFAAATYLRGIAYVQLPTTLLAMVDSSVGGKKAVDLPQGKNLCGCFWQPQLVLCDTDTLATLPADVFADGMAEVIKYAVLGDGALFETLRREDARAAMQQVICRCVQMK
ncbi:MAG: 3-dehydroquinate synthase, partial [Oscillospiraceae bacterium]|nr:3-dehydroquinate synthase [Oscillospiraceae bacterium]